MPTINQYSSVSQVSGGDQLPIWVTNNGDTRRVSITRLLEYFQQTFAAPTVSTNLYTPGTGFNITVPTPTTAQQWMFADESWSLGLTEADMDPVQAWCHEHDCGRRMSFDTFEFRDQQEITLFLLRWS